MSDLKEYRIVLNGTETTAMLNEADAKRLDAVLVDAPAAAARPSEKAAAPPTMARLAANKGRR